MNIDVYYKGFKTLKRPFSHSRKHALAMEAALPMKRGERIDFCPPLV